MRWKAFFFLNNQDTDDTTRQTFGFKSQRSPPHVNELNEFEDCMQNMIQRIQFRTDHQPSNLQRKLANDPKEIREDKHIYVKADKTTNHYKTEPKDYVTLVHKNVTKAYKKTNQNVPNVIASVDKKVAEKVGLDDRIEVSANRDSFITMKDHKPDFLNNPTCRLINPSKSEIRIDDIRIPRRPWDERLHSMIARLKRGTFWQNTNKHWLVAAESLQNDRNQQKTARFKS